MTQSGSVTLRFKGLLLFFLSLATADVVEDFSCIEYTNASFPTVWKFVPVGDIEGIFEEETVAIALQSVQLHGVDGSLAYYVDDEGPEWRPIDHPAPQHAFVVGSHHYIRFIPSNSTSFSHGVLLVNYTIYTDEKEIGAYVDLESEDMLDNSVKTFAIFEFPKKVPPRLVNTDNYIYTVLENSQEGILFNASTAFEDISPEGSTVSNIPAWLEEHLEPDVLDVYELELAEIRNMTSVQLYIRGEYNPSIGKWEKQDGLDSNWTEVYPLSHPSLGNPNVLESDAVIRFLPAENYYGKLLYEVVGGLQLFYTDGPGLVCPYRYSPEYQRILRLLQRKCYFPGVLPGIHIDSVLVSNIDILAMLHCEVVSWQLEATEESIYNILQYIPDIDTDGIFHLFKEVYEKSLAPEGRMHDSLPSRYHMSSTQYDEHSGMFYFADNQSAFLLLEVTSSYQRFPTVWSFVPLIEVDELFDNEPGDIVIQSVEMFGVNGSLAVYRESLSWEILENISPDNTETVDPDDYIKFIPSNNMSVSHGVILVNYTEAADSENIKTFTIFEFPKKIPPQIVVREDVYSIPENSQGEYIFNSSTRYEDISPRVPSQSSIPAWLERYLERDIFDVYNVELSEIRNMTPVYLYIGGDFDNPFKGKWQVREEPSMNWTDAKISVRFPSFQHPLEAAPDSVSRFIPAPNYYGTSAYEVVGAMALYYRDDPGFACLYSYSPVYQRIIRVLKRRGNFPGIFSEDLLTLWLKLRTLARAHCKLVSLQLEPTDGNVEHILYEFPEIDVDGILHLLLEVYERSLGPEGAMSIPPTSRYHMSLTKYDEHSGMYYFVDDHSAFVLLDVVPSYSRIPTVWSFVRLREVDGIFDDEPGNIVIQSVEMFGVTGSLAVYRGSRGSPPWAILENISPDNTETVDPDDYIKFIPSNNMSVSHGVILVNYTEAAAVKTFAIFEFPKKIPPRIVVDENVYSVAESSQGENIFNSSAVFEDRSPKVPTGSSIPAWLEQYLEPDVVDVYNKELAEIKNMNAVHLYIGGDFDDPFKGKWQVREEPGMNWKDAEISVRFPSLGHPVEAPQDGLSRFIPVQNYYGKSTYEVVGAMGLYYRDDPGLACLYRYSPEYQRIFRVLERREKFPGIYTDIHSLWSKIQILAKAHCEIVSWQLEPTEQSIQQILHYFPGIDVDETFQFFQEVYHKSMEPEGSMSDSPSSKYRMSSTKYDEHSGMYYYVDDHSAFLLLDVVPSYQRIPTVWSFVHLREIYGIFDDEPGNIVIQSVEMFGVTGSLAVYRGSPPWEILENISPDNTETVDPDDYVRFIPFNNMSVSHGVILVNYTEAADSQNIKTFAIFEFPKKIPLRIFIHENVYSVTENSQGEKIFNSSVLYEDLSPKVPTGSSIPAWLEQYLEPDVVDVYNEELAELREGIPFYLYIGGDFDNPSMGKWQVEEEDKGWVDADIQVRFPSLREPLITPPDSVSRFIPAQNYYGKSTYEVVGAMGLYYRDDPGLTCLYRYSPEYQRIFRVLKRRGNFPGIYTDIYSLWSKIQLLAKAHCEIVSWQLEPTEESIQHILHYFPGIDVDETFQFFQDVYHKNDILWEDMYRFYPFADDNGVESITDEEEELCHASEDEVSVFAYLIPQPCYVFLPENQLKVWGAAYPWPPSRYRMSSTKYDEHSGMYYFVDDHSAFVLLDVVPSYPRIPTVWSFVHLHEIDGIFDDEPGNIVIQSVEMFGVTGSLAVYRGSPPWEILENISPDNTETVDPDDYIGFIPFNNMSVSHGVILVNYTEAADSENIKTFAIFEFPKKIPPHVIAQNFYSIAENSQGENIFNSSAMYLDISPKVSTSSSIPDWLEQYLEYDVVDIYKKELAEIGDMTPFYLYIGGDFNDPSKGKWQIEEEGKGWVDADIQVQFPSLREPLATQPHELSRFIPAPNYYGKSAYEVVGAMGLYYTDDPGLACLYRYSPEYQRIFRVLQRRGSFPGISTDVYSLWLKLQTLAKAHCEVVSWQLEPTEESIHYILHFFPGIDVDGTLQLFRDVYNKSLAPGGRMPPPSRYRMSLSKYGEHSGMYYFVDELSTAMWLEVTPSYPRIPTVWSFVRLREIDGIFDDEPGDIAIQSFEMFGVTGSLAVYRGSPPREILENISPDNTETVDPDDYIRFIPSNNISHGVILVNYTEAAESEKVKTFAILEFPKIIPPRLVTKQDYFSVSHSSPGEPIFRSSSIYEDISPTVSNESTIPEWLEQYLEADVLDIYKKELSEIRKTIPFYLIIGGDYRPSKGKWQVRDGPDMDWEDAHIPIIYPSLREPLPTQPYGESRFFPAENYYGKSSFEIVGAVGLYYTDEPGLACLYRYSPEYQRIFRVLKRRGSFPGISTDLSSLLSKIRTLAKAHCEVVSWQMQPSEDSVEIILRNFPGIDVDETLHLFRNVYDKSLEPEEKIGTPPPSRYRMSLTKYDEHSGMYYFVDSHSAYVWLDVAPPHSIIPTVWSFVRLREVDGIFDDEPGDIVIQSVEMFGVTGSLAVYRGSPPWEILENISPDNTETVDPDDYIKFIPSNNMSVSHGVILVNYTEAADSENIKTFAIFEFPKKIPPRVVSLVDVYSIAENSQDDHIFNSSVLYEDISPKVPTDSSVPYWLEKYLERDVLEIYELELAEISETIPFYLYIGGDFDNPSIGKWQMEEEGKGWVDADIQVRFPSLREPLATQPGVGVSRFVPAPNYYGTSTYEVVGAMGLYYRDDPGLACLYRYSPEYQRIFRVLQRRGSFPGISLDGSLSSGLGALAKAHCEVVIEQREPTDDSIEDILSGFPGVDVDSIVNLFREVKTQSLAPEGEPNDPPFFRYRMAITPYDEHSGMFYFVDERSAFLSVEVTPTNARLPAVWKFVPIGDIEGIFNGEVAIAIQSVEFYGVDGSLAVYLSQNWQTIDNVSPARSFVVGPDYHLSFIPLDDPSSLLHGIIVVNYTAYDAASFIGEFVDLSSESEASVKTFVIFEFPRKVPPRLEFNGDVYMVTEDIRGGEGFDPSDKYEDISPQFSNESTIPDWMRSRLDLDLLDMYTEELWEIQKMTTAYLFIEGDYDNPSTGKWQIKAPEGDWEDARPRRYPSISDPNEVPIGLRLRFIPAKDYFGISSYEAVGALMHFAEDPRETCLYSFSPDFHRIFKVLRKKGEFPGISFAESMMPNVGFLGQTLCELMYHRMEPTNDSMNDFLRNNFDTEDAEKTFDLFLQVSETSLALGGSTDPPQYSQARVILKEIHPGGAVFFYADDTVAAIRMEVTPVNDPPQLIKFILALKPIPYDFVSYPGDGTVISEIFDCDAHQQSVDDDDYEPFIRDIDNDCSDLGLAVYDTGSSSLGSWEYMMNDSSSWTPFDITRDVNAVLLDPDARIRFHLYSRDEVWTRTTALRELFFLAHVWDQEDGRSAGTYLVSDIITDDLSSFSRNSLKVVVLREGCDGRIDFPAKPDRCGVCRGKNLCVGCDDVPNSGAKRNKCGHCVGGTTNRNASYGFDCAKQCGNQNYLGPCGGCQSRDPSKFINFTDCTGTCRGGAYINRCGRCVEGSTGREEYQGEDACGVCGGDNSSCLDCAGVPNGINVNDICGICLAEDDPDYNSLCVKLGSLIPVSGEVIGGTTVTIRGAGFRNRTSVECRFVDADGTEFNSNSELKASELKIIVTSPSLPVGEYSPECQFDGIGAWIGVENKTFSVYNRSAILLTSITPNETHISSSGSSFSTSLTGFGFADTGFLKCVLSSRVNGFQIRVPASFVSSVEILCIFPLSRRSSLLDVGLVSGRSDPPATSTVGFLFYAVQPEAVSIRFQRNPRVLLLNLDRPAKRKTKSYSCVGIFDASAVQTFGSESSCVLVTVTKLIIILGANATVVPHQQAIFINGSFVASSQEQTKIIPGYTTLYVEPPLNPPMPTVTMFGQSVIGPCDELTIEIAYSNGGSRDMQFEWYVKNRAGLDANTTADMEALNASLASETADLITIGSEFIVRNVYYEIGVRVTNFLGYSGEACLNVTRQQKEVPKVVLNSAGRTIKASEKLLLRARAVLKGCNSSSDAFVYQYTVYDSSGNEVDLGIGTVKNKAYFRLLPGILPGGQSYLVTVTVSDKKDQRITSEKSIPITVESSELKPTVRGGESIDVGIADNLTLDASLSLDPDDPSDEIEESIFSWDCRDKDGFPCVEVLPDGSRTRLVLPEGRVIAKAVATFLDVGETYSFVLTMSKGERSAEKSFQVRVQSCSPPRIDIAPIAASKVNRRSVVSVQGRVTAEGLTANITWSSVEEDELAFVDDDLQAVSDTVTSFQIFSQPGTGFIDREVSLVLRPNVLSSGTYRFRIDVVTGTCSAYSETTVTINSAPSTGSLTITPSSGTALDTEFTFTADGFTDDEEDLPLRYIFSYIEITEDGREEWRVLGQKNEQKRKTEIKLPQGDSNKGNTLRVVVEVFDIHNAIVSVEVTVTVNPLVLDLVSVSALGKTVDLLGKNENTERLLGFIGPIMTAFDFIGEVSAEVEEQVRAVREKCVDGALIVLNTVSGDSDSRMDVYSTMGEATEGGSEMSEDIKDNFFKILKEIELIIRSSRRRRRSVDSDSVLDLEGYSASQAETTLKSPSNLLSPDVYTNSESTRKADFLALVDSVGQKMCAYISLGFPPSVAINPLVALRADAKPFDNVDTEFTDMASTAKMLLGESLKTLFTDWSCTSSETCTWACVLSSQFPYDLLINETNNSSLTDIVDLKFYNPKTYRAVQIDTLSSPVTFRIPLKTNVTFPNESSVQCKLWSEDEQMWSTVGCVSSQTPIVSGNTTYVECSCTQLGYLTVFDGDRMSLITPTSVRSTVASSTALPPSTTANIPVYDNGANVQFSFNADYDVQVSRAGSVANLTSQMRKGVAAEIGRNYSELRDFTISNGSIFVQFLLLPRSDESVVSFNKLLTSLENQIKSGNFSITLSGGAVLTADPTSFAVTAVASTVGAPTTVGQLKEDKDHTTIIIIACVCGGVVLIVVIVVTVYFMKNKKDTRKVLPTPEPNELEMLDGVQYTRNELGHCMTPVEEPKQV